MIKKKVFSSYLNQVSTQAFDPEDQPKTLGPSLQKSKPLFQSLPAIEKELENFTLNTKKYKPKTVTFTNSVTVCVFFTQESVEQLSTRILAELSAEVQNEKLLLKTKSYPKGSLKN